MLRQGVALRREHRDEEALTLFRRAFDLAPSAVARAQIALAEEALGRWIESERDLAAALESADDPWILKNREALEGAREDVGRHLAWITVAVDAAGTEAKLGDRQLKLGVEERVVAGRVRVELEAPEYVTASRQVEVAAGEHRTIDVTMSSVPAPFVRPVDLTEMTAPPDDRRTSVVSIVGPAVLAGAGLVGLGAGTYFGVRAIDRKTARDAECGANGCTLSGLSLDQNVRQDALLSTASLGVGLALVAAGATWWIADAPLRPRTAPVPSTGAIVLGSLGLGATGAGVGFGLNALAKKEARDAQCSSAGCSSAALGYDTEARTSATLSTASFLGALIFFAGATFVWTTNRIVHAQWRIAPSVEPHAAGLTVGGPIE